MAVVLRQNTAWSARLGHTRTKAARPRPVLDLMGDGNRWVYMHTLCTFDRKKNHGGHGIALRLG